MAFGYSPVSGCFVVHVTHSPQKGQLGTLVLSFINGMLVPSCAVRAPVRAWCIYAAVFVLLVAEEDEAIKIGPWVRLAAVPLGRQEEEGFLVKPDSRGSGPRPSPSRSRLQTVMPA